jgi:hypothetical protein
VSVLTCKSASSKIKGDSTTLYNCVDVGGAVTDES